MDGTAVIISTATSESPRGSMSFVTASSPCLFAIFYICSKASCISSCRAFSEPRSPVLRFCSKIEISFM